MAEGDRGAEPLAAGRPAIFRGRPHHHVILNFALEPSRCARQISIDRLRRPNRRQGARALPACERHRDARFTGEASRSSRSLGGRLAAHIVGTSDFAEGVRAILIDEDLNPRWDLAALEMINHATACKFLEAPLGESTLHST